VLAAESPATIDAINAYLPVVALNGVAFGGFVVGFILFGMAMAKTAAFPRAAGLLVAVGAPSQVLAFALAQTVAPALWTVAILGGVALSAGLAWPGYQLWRQPASGSVLAGGMMARWKYQHALPTNRVAWYGRARDANMGEVTGRSGSPLRAPRLWSAQSLSGDPGTWARRGHASRGQQAGGATVLPGGHQRPEPGRHGRAADPRWGRPHLRQPERRAGKAVLRHGPTGLPRPARRGPRRDRRGRPGGRPGDLYRHPPGRVCRHPRDRQADHHQRGRLLPDAGWPAGRALGRAGHVQLPCTGGRAALATHTPLGRVSKVGGVA